MPSFIRSAPFRLFSFLLWMLLVLGGYYWVHKPITPDLLLAPLKAMIDVLLAFLILALCSGLGRFFLPASHLPALTRIALQSALGSGIFGLLWMGLGSLNLYQVWVGWFLLAAGLIILRKPTMEWTKDLTTLKDTLSGVGLLEKLLAGAAVMIILLSLLFALSPPTRWDALADHLYLPQQFLRSGGLTETVANPLWGHPKLGEMLYTWAMLLSARSQTAAVLGWFYGIVLILGVFGLAARLPPGWQNSDQYTSPTAGWAAVTALLAGLTARHMLSWAYVDLFSALMGLAVTVAVLEWIETRQAAWLRWCGVFIGFAVSIKWTAGIIAIGIFTALILFIKRLKTPLPLLIQSALLALLVYLPWSLKNLVMTGNPLYPYLFPSPSVSALRLAAVSSPVSTANGWLQAVLPLSLTWMGVDSAPGFATDIGPLLLLLAVPGLWFQRRSPAAQVLGVCLLAGWLALSILGTRYEHFSQARLYFVLLPALALSAGWGWQALEKVVLSGVRLRRLMGAVLLLVMALAVWQDLAEQARLAPGSVILGRKSEDQYLDDSLGWYAPTMRALHQLPPASRVLMLWEPRGLYAPSLTQSDPWIDNWRMILWQEKSPQAILDSWKRQGYSHMLLYNSGAEFVRESSTQLSASDWQVFDDLLARLPQPLSFGNIYSLYRLNP